MNPIYYIALLLLLLSAGCTTTYRVHRLDGAEAEVRHALIHRDSEIVDLALVGKDLVKNFGPKLAWQAVTEVWDELTGGAPLSRASDVIWLQDQGAHTQSVAWLIQFRQEWMP